MNNFLPVPQFGVEEDRHAPDQIMKLFPEYTAKGQVDTIEANVLIKDSAVLNGASLSICQ
jgi:hypothetical protein